jgi:hypothetical protein
MRKPRSIIEKPALDVIDESVALLRRCPLAVGVLYYVGAIPFVLAFLYFWADMSSGAFARQHLIQSSLLVALGFLWCKFWQSLFATHLLAVAARRTLPPWTWRKLFRLAAAQASIQSTSLFVMPVAALITIPLGVAYAFYHNASILALDASCEPQDAAFLRREALAQAGRWPAQNYIGISILWFFWLTVFLNIMILILFLPMLLKTLLGIETMVSRSLFSMFNTTLFAAAAGIAWLCVDPLVKAFYVVRCFHGRALSTGEDLEIKIRALSPRRFQAIAAILLLFCAGLARAAEPPATQPAAAAPASPRSADIDQSITDVLNRPEFAWRAPREAANAADKGGVDGFIQGIFDMVGRWLKPVKQWAREFLDWLGEHLRPRDDGQSNSRGFSWGASLQFFAWLFCAAAVCALGIIGWKIWLRRGDSVRVIAEPQQIIPDLNSEDIAADQLPEDAWIGLAREMIQKGELRLALRAFYLAALAHLGERRIISIARYKSNLDYQRELRRRRPTQADLIATFSDTVGSFERAWYGMHEVNPEILDASQVNLEKIRDS